MKSLPCQLQNQKTRQSRSSIDLQFFRELQPAFFRPCALIGGKGLGFVEMAFGIGIGGIGIGRMDLLFVSALPLILFNINVMIAMIVILG